jgi:hypothetical protein
LYLIDSVCVIKLSSLANDAYFAPFWLRCHSIVTQTLCFQVLFSQRLPATPAALLSLNRA